MAKTIISNIDAFAKEVSAAIATRTEAEVTVAKVNKNNGLVLTGIVVKGHNNVAPTLYLEKFFEQHTNGTSLEEICDEILETLSEVEVKEDLDCSWFTDWEQVKEKMSMKLINLEANTKFLEEVPHMVFGDLAIIFQIVVESLPAGRGTITVRTEHAAAWGVDTDALYEAAKGNREDISIRPMYEVLSEMMGDVPMDLIPPMEEPVMYVMSNTEKINGAIALENLDVLKAFAEEHGSFYILPSSIHECLLVPAEGDEEELTAMVQEVNATQVADDEVLSNHAYYFNAATMQLLTGVDGQVMSVVAA